MGIATGFFRLGDNATTVVAGGVVSFTNPNLFVITGSPGAGKTTVIRELTKLGFRHAPDVARQIIQEQIATGGKALPWEDRKTYTYLMLRRFIESYRKHTPAPQPTFSEWGIPDSLGYARLIGLQDDEDVLKAACREYRYAQRALVTPPWKEIYGTDAERKQDFAEAEATYARVVEVYQECGYEIVELPKVNAVARAAFIVKQLHLDN